MAKIILTPFTFSAGGNAINNNAAATVPLTIKGAASQSASLLEIRNSSNTLLSYTLSNGDWVMPNLFNSYAGVGMGYADYQGTATSLYVRPTATTRSGAVIKALASQTANIFEIQDSAGTVLTAVSNIGTMRAPIFASATAGLTAIWTNYDTSGIGIVPTSAAQKGLIIRGAASQSANLTEWQDSSANILANVNSAGILNMTRAIILTQTNAGEVGIRVKGAVSQTGNLAEYLDSSANVQVRIDPNANIYTGTMARATSSVNTIHLSNATIPTANPTGGGVLYVDTGALKYRGTSGSAATIVNADGTTAGGGSFTGGTLTSGLVLATGTTSLQPLKYVAGTNLTTPVTGVKEYDGTVFYQTSDTNPGRALSTQNYYYTSSSDYIPDFSASGSVKSMLGAATRGITVAAGTTYEYELFAAVRHQFAVQTGISGTYQMSNTTVSGSPVVAHVSYVDYGSNTTGFTTATTMSSVRDTGNTLFMAAISSGSRYAILEVKGTIRVTGTGTTKIFPGLSVSAANDNTWTVSSGLIFKMTPIGNGTVTSVGTWA